MGYMRHHAIIVTSWDRDLLTEAHKLAEKTFPQVSPLSDEAINGYSSFFIPPDGSKEGWEESEVGDARRLKYTSWLRKQTHDNGSYSLSWVEVQYGDDDGVTRIISDSDQKSPDSRERVETSE